MRFENTVRIDRSVEDVFAFLAEFENDPEPEDGGTRLTNSAQLEGHGLAKLTAPLASGRIAEAVSENLTTLKRLLEST